MQFGLQNAMQKVLKSYFLTVRKIIRFDFADELKVRGLRHICIGEQGGVGSGGGGSTPSEKNFYDPPLRFKMTPTPSEMAFDPL